MGESLIINNTFASKEDLIINNTFVSKKAFFESLQPHISDFFSAVALRGQVSYDEKYGHWTFDSETKISDEKIGYYAYAKLNDGNIVTMFKTVSEMQKHASKHSKQYNDGVGLWIEHFDLMAINFIERTLLKRIAVIVRGNSKPYLV